jgi:hypothetical protein
MRWGLSVIGAVAMIVSLSSPASAQVTVTGGLDFTNQYNFRGIRQNVDPVSIWPYIDLGFAAFSGDGGLKSAGVNVGMWNAIHTELDDNKWYEADYYATLGLGFGGGVSLGTTYTSYTSPADLFAHVKELAFKLAVDDSAALGKGALKPYVVVAFELSDDGQADAGAAKGTYVELGVAPGYAGSKASLAIPVKIGLSASDYYEFGTGSDSKFGYFSIGGIVTVPFGKANIHGGVEFQTFGDNVKAYNGFGDDGDGPATIASIGLGFAF